MKYFIAGAVAIVLLISGIILFSGEEMPTPPAASTDSIMTPPGTDGKVVVTYDSSGFKPQTITINKGTTVTFINKSEMPLYVASNPHPQHTDYPEFEAVRANNGRMPRMTDTFSFKFEKTGTWGYHNHTASSDTGTEAVHPGTVTVK